MLLWRRRKGIPGGVVDGFEVDDVELRKSAGAARSVADQAGGLSLGEALAGCAEGICGAGAVAVAARVGQGWQQALTQWTAQVRDYAAGLEASAATYQGSEDAAVTGFSPTGPTDGTSGSSPTDGTGHTDGTSHTDGTGSTDDTDFSYLADAF
jgi:hypothetical protein